MRSRRRKRESEFLGAFVFFLFVIGTLLVSSDAGAGAVWVLALGGGVGVFLLCVRFIYAVEGERRYQRGEAPPGVRDVVLPRFPALLFSLLVVAVWLGVFLFGPFDTGAVTLFFCLLGFSFALIIGKGVERVIDEIARSREMHEPRD